MIPGVGLDHSFHWSALTALDYHYWSQPLPTVFGWWARQKPGMVQAFLGRILPGGGDHCAIFYLGAAPATAHCCWLDSFFANRDCCHRQLLLLQSAHDRFVFIAD